ncbi:MAG: response regulator [Candidatus Omnitrophota bacterium]
MIKNVVVADDDRGSALLMASCLEKEGYRVYTAGNGRQVLDIIKNNPVDLVITDVVMPEMDGVDLYTELKSNPATENLPIIIITDKDVFQESFSALGVDFYTPKPFNFKDLQAKINKVDIQSQESSRIHKVAVIGPKKDVISKMGAILQSKNCIVGQVDSVIEIGLRCFLLNPSIIFIDLFSTDYAFSREIIKSLRSYAFFKNTKIVLYSTVTQEEASNSQLLDGIQTEIKECMSSGADHYIGRFNQVTFAEQLKEFNIY